MTRVGKKKKTRQNCVFCDKTEPKATKSSGSTKTCSVVITKLVERWSGGVIFSFAMESKNTFWLVFLICLGSLKPFLNEMKSRHTSQKAFCFSLRVTVKRTLGGREKEGGGKNQKHHLTSF